MRLESSSGLPSWTTSVVRSLELNESVFVYSSTLGSCETWGSRISDSLWEPGSYWSSSSSEYSSGIFESLRPTRNFLYFEALKGTTSGDKSSCTSLVVPTWIATSDFNDLSGFVTLALIDMSASLLWSDGSCGTGHSKAATPLWSADSCVLSPNLVVGLMECWMLPFLLLKSSAFCSASNSFSILDLPWIWILLEYWTSTHVTSQWPCLW